MASRRAGRYVLHDAIASGGMASVHLGRVVAPGGFSRTVAIKRLHPHLACDPEFVEMFLDEARLASRIHHPNVVSTLDVVNDDGELLLVMDYVLGESWWNILKVTRERGKTIPIDVSAAVLCDLLNGLHAAHEATLETGEPLGIVHRDVSPQNVLVGADGIARVVDFGIAKAISRVHSTRDGEIKGKLRYMSPEQLLRTKVDRRADLYAAGVVLWESLTNERLFTADDAAGTIAAVLQGRPPRPSTVRADIPPALDDLVMRALAQSADNRPASALELARALEVAVTPATTRAVAEFVVGILRDRLDARKKLIAEVEAAPSSDKVGTAAPVSGPLSVAERKALAAADTAVSAIAPSPAISRALSDDGTTTATMTDPVKPETLRPASRRPRRVLVAFALALVAIGGVALWVSRTTKAAHPAAPPVVALEPPAPSTTHSAPAIALSFATPNGAAAAPAPVPAPSSSAAVVGTSKAPARRGAPPARPAAAMRAPAPASAQAPPVNDCNPPYTLDDNGVKRFKPGCI